MALDRQAYDDVIGLHAGGHVRRHRLPEPHRVLDVGGARTSLCSTMTARARRDSNACRASNPCTVGMEILKDSLRVFGRLTCPASCPDTN